MKTGIELIAAERQRQLEVEKWDAGHDDEHDSEELARAAACYAMPTSWRKYFAGFVAAIWPWLDGWKPTPDNRIRELAKSGALSAAEIDRLQRKC
jgi:hypothetical protein